MSNYDRWKTRSDRDDSPSEHDHAESPEGDEFSVVQFFPDGEGHEYVRRGVSAEEAVRAARHYTDNVAAHVGLVERVIIVDGDDFCCFEWKRGEGVTYPLEMRGRQ